MKTAGASRIAGLAEKVTYEATLWTITRRDGEVFRFTDHDVDITYAGDTYTAAVGYSRTAIAAKSDLAVNNLDVQGIFDADAITEQDLRTGLYNGADVRIASVDWMTPANGVIALHRGFFGDAVLTPEGIFEVPLLGFTQILQQGVGTVMGPRCSASLGDTRCGVDIEAGYRKTATVASVISDLAFTITVTEPRAVDGWFRLGVVTWTSGDNNGRLAEIKTWTESSSRVDLFLPAATPIQVGDTLTLYPGCDGLIATCLAKFNNVLRHRGFPLMPGIDGLIQTPGGQVA